METNKNIVQLHNHLIFSVLDGFNKPVEFARRAKELGMTHLAVTDHNHLAGVVDFKNACEAEGIFPILGVETYFTKDTDVLRLSADERYNYAVAKAREAGVEVPEFVTETGKSGKEKKRKIKKMEVKDLLAPYNYDTKQYHLILLAKSQTGWNNLVKLQSEAAEKCTFNGRFLCDDTMLAKYHEGVICTSACIGSITANMINKGLIDEALQQVLAWKEIFGKDFYLEIQPLNIEEQIKVNSYYIDWSDQYDIPLVATTDCHYTLKEDWQDHDVLVCIGTGKTVDDDTRMKYENEYWLRSREEMIEGFQRHIGDDPDTNDWYMQHVETALNNTTVIANQIEEITLGSSNALFPKVDTPNGVTPEQWLESQCWQGLYKLKDEDQSIDLDAYGKRLNYELGIINKKGFAPYLHTVHEYVKWAEENNSPVGPGRGSAAGSLCLFSLGITKNVDPIKYDLLFERFLTEDRTAPPDIDLDFSDKDTVIEHLKEHYGADHVAHIGTFGTMGVKSGLKDVGRALNMPFDVMNKITKGIDDILEIPNMKFKDLDNLKDTDPNNYTAFHEMEEENPELFRLARRFEGNIRSLGVHASGILVTPMPITDMFPTRSDENGLVTLWEHNCLEEFGAINL